MCNIYGERLKAQREAAGLTQQELAVAAIMTRSHIAHIEAGRRIPSKKDARRLDRALNTGDVLSSFLREGDAAVADRFEVARQLEQQVEIIREFALPLVPGTLQTEARICARFCALPSLHRVKRSVTGSLSHGLYAQNCWPTRQRL